LVVLSFFLGRLYVNVHLIFVLLNVPVIVLVVKINFVFECFLKAKNGALERIVVNARVSLFCWNGDPPLFNFLCSCNSEAFRLGLNEIFLYRDGPTNIFGWYTFWNARNHDR